MANSILSEHVRALANKLRAGRGLGPIPEEARYCEYCQYCGYVFGAATEEEMEAERGRHRQFCDEATEDDD